MLRVEASNLPNPRGIPRPRRLLPNPPGTTRRGWSSARHEMLPPPEETTQVTQVRAPSPSRISIVDNERWSVKLELGDEEIAKLYGQGMARGAVVWRKGMVEWRPLLITPEFKNILRRTRISVPPSAPPRHNRCQRFASRRSAHVAPRGAHAQSMPPSSQFRFVLDDRPIAADGRLPRPETRPIELAAVGRRVRASLESDPQP